METNLNSALAGKLKKKCSSLQISGFCFKEKQLRFCTRAPLVIWEFWDIFINESLLFISTARFLHFQLLSKFCISLENQSFLPSPHKMKRNWPTFLSVLVFHVGREISKGTCGKSRNGKRAIGSSLAHMGPAASGVMTESGQLVKGLTSSSGKF